MTNKKQDLQGIEAAIASFQTASKTARLSQTQETEAIEVFSKALLLGKSGITLASGAALNLPWAVGVEGTSKVWTELKPAAKKQFLSGLVSETHEQSRRFRLSLGRGLLPIEPAVSLKLIEAVSKEMVEASTDGMLTQKDQQSFANVLIGKGKPWILLLPLAELKPAQMDPVLQALVSCCFPGRLPPYTQSAVLEWLVSLDAIGRIPSSMLELIAKAVQRWHPKFHTTLNPEQLPAPIREVLEQRKSASNQPTQKILPPQQAESRQEPVSEEAPKKEVSSEGEPKKNETSEMLRNLARQPSTRDQKQRNGDPVQRPPQSRPNNAGGFDLQSTLRQIDSHVANLKSDLNQAKAEIRRLQSSGSVKKERSKGSNPLDSAPGASIEELQRHNRQLEETILELRGRMDELLAHHEDIATSMGAHNDAPLDDPKEQFKSLIAIKLQSDYSQFLELAKIPQDAVFREPFRILLADVFQALKDLGIGFEGKPVG